jgi:hypothetical protein
LAKEEKTAAELETMILYELAPHLDEIDIDIPSVGATSDGSGGWNASAFMRGGGDTRISTRVQEICGKLREKYDLKEG